MRTKISTLMEKVIRAFLSGIEYSFLPITYADGRKSVIKIASGHVQSALSDKDYQDLSSEFGLDIAMIKAVIEVESAGSGFLLKEPAPVVYHQALSA